MLLLTSFSVTTWHLLLIHECMTQVEISQHSVLQLYRGWPTVSTHGHNRKMFQGFYLFFWTRQNIHLSKQTILEDAVRKSSWRTDNIFENVKKSVHIYYPFPKLSNLLYLLPPSFCIFSPQETWLRSTFSSLKKTRLGAYCVLDLVSI